jgi:hypothetical protein
MKPLKHAQNSARKFGGAAEDYQAIHDFFDHSKAAVADVRHRAMLHSAWGIYVVEQVFGTAIVNSEGRQVCVRDIGEQHVIEDLGFIPTMDHWLKHMEIAPWMGGQSRKRACVRTMPLVD